MSSDMNLHEDTHSAAVIVEARHAIVFELSVPILKEEHKPYRETFYCQRKTKWRRALTAATQ